MTPTQLQRIHRLCHREWAMQGDGLGLSFSEFEYLSVIKDEEDRMRVEDAHGQHLQDIVAALGVAKPSASAMVGKLEGRGLVQRFQCKQDARAQHIVLTETGQALLATGLSVYEQLAERVTDDLLQNGKGTQ